MGMREPTAGLRSSSVTPDISDWGAQIRARPGSAISPRTGTGTATSEAPLWENRILGHQTESLNVSGQLIDARGAKQDTQRPSCATYDVRPLDLRHGRFALRRQPAKLIVGREMSHNPRCSSPPTRPGGVDVGACLRDLGPDPSRPARRAWAC